MASSSPPWRRGPGTRFLFKLRYSAFDFTPPEALLRELETERLLLAGAASERCVAQDGDRGARARAEGDRARLGVRADRRARRAIALEYLERIAGARIEHGPLAAILGG